LPDKPVTVGPSFDPSDRVAAEVVSRLAGRHLLLLTDYDGTLADLAPVPAQAFVSQEIRDELDALAASEAITVGVVSGRRLFDVAERIGPAAEFVAGLHGLEITGPDAAFHHYALDSVESVIENILRDAERELAWCPGCLLENKQYALTCHVRLAPPELSGRALEEFEALAEPQLEARVVKLLSAAQAAELLPAVDWHKGRAVQWIRARVASRVDAPVSVVYLGDDRTDEDAFTSLTDADIAIGVGDRPHTHLIDFRLTGPSSVGRFFKAVRQAGRDGRSG
jgi:trehalose-phosphatase